MGTPRFIATDECGAHAEHSSDRRRE